MDSSQNTAPTPKPLLVQIADYLENTISVQREINERLLTIFPQERPLKADCDTESPKVLPIPEDIKNRFILLQKLSLENRDLLGKLIP